MIREASQTTSAGGPTRPRVWGLSAPQLLDAYWRTHGVQCIERGKQAELQRSADLYLLVEPRQLVLFDIVALADRLAWRDAVVTHLRLVSERSDAYGEHVDVDEHGYVREISRRYRAGTESYRVLLTRHRRVAQIWMSGDDRRACWTRIRRQVHASDRETWRCQGSCFAADDPAGERRLIDRLVDSWGTPGRAIEGIERIGEGVWARAGRPIPEGAVVIGPAWIGYESEDAAACLVGPACLEDASDGTTHPATVRAIQDIDPGDRVESDTDHVGSAYRFIKRLCDLAVSGTALLLLAPILLAVSLLMLATDGRPIFFGHVRQARGGRRFRCWKFRTMRRDADAIKRKLQDENACDGPQFYIQHDPRVTRIGAVLRRYHIDELPQLWNVLVGDMSLVGPRPSPESENQMCPAWREVRLSVPPGITGLWQLKRTRKPGMDFQEWIRFDVEYVERASLWLDFKIFLLTVWLIIQRK